MYRHEIRIDMDAVEIVRAALARGIRLGIHPTQRGTVTIMGTDRLTQDEIQVFCLRSYDLVACLRGDPMPVDYGPCCAAGCGETVWNTIYMTYIPYQTPHDGTGWGIAADNVPNNGAISLFCERCGKRATRLKVPTRYAISGEPTSRNRVLVRELYGPFPGVPSRTKPPSAS